MAFSIRPATPADAARLFDLINAAYHTESGDVPPAFKFTTRFLAPEEWERVQGSAAP